MGAAVGEDRLRSRFGRRRPLDQLDDGADFLAPFLIGDADHAAIGDLRAFEQNALDLRRVDVDAAGDDHVGAAIA